MLKSQIIECWTLVGWFENKPKYVVVGVVYQHLENPTHVTDGSNVNLNMLILFLEKPFYCLEDFNINLSNIYARNEIRRYAKSKWKLEFRGAKLWNEIDEDIRYKTFNSFKKMVYRKKRNLVRPA